MASGKSHGSLIQSAKRLEGYLQGSRAIDWRAIVFIQVLFLLFSIVTFDGWIGLNILEIVGRVSAGLVLETFLVLIVGKVFLSGSARNTLWRIWLIYWLAGELTATYLVLVFGLPFSPPGTGLSAVTLLATNGFLKIAWFSIAHLATSLIGEHLQTLAQLKAKTAELSSLRSGVNEQVSAELNALRSAINDKIMAALTLISRQLAELTTSTPREELTERASMVARVCDLEVRALSHEISDSEFEPRLKSFEPKKSWSILLATHPGKPDIQLRWEWVAAIGSLNAITLALQHGGWLSALAATGAILLGIIVVRPLDKWRLKCFNTQSARFDTVLILAEYGLLSVAILGLLWFVGLGVPVIGSFISSVYLVTPIVILVIWVLVQIIHNFADRLAFAQTELADQNQQLEIEVRQARSQAASAKGRLGRLLHGTTQGRLASVSLALTAAATSKSPTVTDELLTQARQQLALAEVELRETLRADGWQTSLDVRRELDDLSAGWRNLVLIKYDLDPQAIEILGDRTELSHAVLDAARECITNAVRHGRAKSVDIRIELRQGLRLIVSNDGKQIDSLVPGFGVSSISATGADFDFSKEGEKTKVCFVWGIDS